MIFFDPSIYWQGVCKHLVDNAPSVGIVRCSKNPVDAREKNIQQRAKSLSLAGASAKLHHLEYSRVVKKQSKNFVIRIFRTIISLVRINDHFTDSHVIIHILTSKNLP